MRNIAIFLQGIPSYWLVIVIIASMVVYGLIGRKYYKNRGWRFFALAVSIIWFAAILFTTILYRNTWIKSINLIPFYRLFSGGNIQDAINDYVSNIVLYLPLGIAFPYILDGRVKHPILETVLVGAIISLITEMTQYIFAVGYAQIEDVIMNSFGALIGTTSYIITKYEKNSI